MDTLHSGRPAALTGLSYPWTVQQAMGAVISLSFGLAKLLAGPTAGLRQRTRGRLRLLPLKLRLRRSHWTRHQATLISEMRAKATKLRPANTTKPSIALPDPARLRRWRGKRQGPWTRRREQNLSAPRLSESGTTPPRPRWRNLPRCWHSVHAN